MTELSNARTGEPEREGRKAIVAGSAAGIGLAVAVGVHDLLTQQRRVVVQQLAIAPRGQAKE